ncbi:MAG: ATP-grasp domain-containing protein, partial [Oleispira sp.]|nr:ATP-grasp domain-containing protein [Oleispira sp.]
AVTVANTSDNAEEDFFGTVETALESGASAPLINEFDDDDSKFWVDYYDSTIQNLAGICSIRDEFVHNAIEKLGLPIIMKTTTEGYDGKGQFVLRKPEDASACWAEIGNRELIAEAFVPFIREISVIGCRNENGDIKVWPMTENIHHEGILRYSLYPAHGFSAEKQAKAEGYIEQIASSLDYVGTITLELFETEDNLIANEVAPRVHNSGHWSIEGAITSQFRNHMLAVTGQNITATESLFPAAAMINVISDEGPTAAGKGMTETYVHSYGKEARTARKLGHVTITAKSSDERDAKISQLEGLIPNGVWQK